MITKLIKHDETLKKWKYFKSRKAAMLSIWILTLMCFFSFTAEFWANSKPLYVKYKGESYFPIFKDYSAKELGIEDAFVIDYRSLRVDTIVWPIIKWDPYESNTKVDEYPAAPSSVNLLGTDDRGRDILVRLLYGLRYSMTFAFFVWIITFICATVLGGAQGYWGDKVDLYGQRFTEVLSTVPQLFLLIILISIFQPSLILLVLINCAFGWIGMSYYMRAEFLRNRKKEYVEAARAIGCGHGRIFFKHILPNSLSPLITFSPFALAGNITGLAALDYLGFGLVPPTPSWGELLAQAQSNFTIAWWLALFPSLALFSVLVMLALIGDGVRDTMDPHRT